MKGGRDTKRIKFKKNFVKRIKGNDEFQSKKFWGKLIFKLIIIRIKLILSFPNWK